MVKMILLSVKPFYLDKILNCKKIIELRKRVGVAFQPNTKIYLYASSPVKAIVGTASLKAVAKVPLDEATNEKNDIFNKACISQSDFNDYFLHADFCYFLHLESVKRAISPVSLKTLRSMGITPPQSFCYLVTENITAIDSILEGK
ncbi:hypothetical protein [Pantoea sp. UYEF8]|uniref:hypothetical protein n=1 Tax=Pantoea sp. UYEF8 TaxID=1756394 RepID=UPI00339B8ABB